MQISTIRALSAAALAATALGAAAPAAADEHAGRVLYVTYCASCHGIDATGDGPVAKSLVRKPPDLTRLAERFGSPLSPSKVAEYIDGRLDVLAHGPRDMPVWGERFKTDPEPGQPVTEDSGRLSIRVIVDYLLSIQAVQDAGRGPEGPALGG